MPKDPPTPHTLLSFLAYCTVTGFPQLEGVENTLPALQASLSMESIAQFLEGNNLPYRGWLGDERGATCLSFTELSGCCTPSPDNSLGQTTSLRRSQISLRKSTSSAQATAAFTALWKEGSSSMLVTGHLGLGERRQSM